jgi:hypothetical protein
MSRAQQLEEKVKAIAADLKKEFADLGEGGGWTLGRALIHQRVHAGTDGGAAQYCAIATYLAEMIAHAHAVAHGEKAGPNAHRDVVH